jgi:lysophospholipid acyltransferase (LPLAT)-like uncharacterized protein
MLGTVEDPEFRVAGFRLKARTLAAWIAGFLRLLGKTMRLQLIDDAGYLKNTHPGEYIFIFWHNRLMGMPMAFQKWCGNRKGAVGLTSASGEGTLLTMVMEKLGVRTVRGSSSRRGASATLALIRELKNGHDVVITPDGPRGPRYHLHMGPLFLAQATGRPILAVQVEYSRCIRLGTWDRFMIPLPFGRVVFRSQPLFFVPPNLSADELEDYRKRLEAVMQPVTL